jgi:hypothetical protein
MKRFILKLTSITATMVYSAVFMLMFIWFVCTANQMVGLVALILLLTVFLSTMINDLIE